VPSKPLKRSQNPTINPENAAVTTKYFGVKMTKKKKDIKGTGYSSKKKKKNPKRETKG
jgi:hypothetical protein